MMLTPRDLHNAEVHRILGVGEDDCDPSILYHYTDASGFLNIIQSQELWATNILYLNDPSEIQYSRSVGHQFVQTLPADSHVCKILRAGLGYLKSVEDPGSIDIFAVCFCSKSDLLSQWRAYGRHGTGFALGFKTSMLTELVSNEERFNNSLALLPIVYTKAKQLRLMTEFALSLGRPGLSEVDCMRQMTTWMNLVLKFKNPLFREENEWRLSIVQFHPNNDPHYRVKDGNIVPYANVRLTYPALLSSVSIGPSVDAALTKRAVQDALRRHGFGRATVDASNVPAKRMGII